MSDYETDSYNAGFYYGRFMQRAAIIEWLRNHAHHNRPADIVKAIQDMVIDGKPEESEPTQEEKDQWKKI